jgi:hypothetical protein
MIYFLSLSITVAHLGFSACSIFSTVSLSIVPKEESSHGIRISACAHNFYLPKNASSACFAFL